MAIVKIDGFESYTPGAAVMTGYNVDAGWLILTTSHYNGAQSIEWTASNNTGNVFFATKDANAGNVHTAIKFLTPPSFGSTGSLGWAVNLLQRLNSATTVTGSTYYRGYVFEFTAAPGIGLFKVVAGTQTALGSVVPITNLAVSTWYELHLTTSGSATTTVTLAIRRLADNFWMNSSGVFVSSQVNTHSVADSSSPITGIGFAAFRGTQSLTSGPAVMDDFRFEDLPGQAVSYTLTGPTGGALGVASTNFTVALPASTTTDNTVVVTPASSGTGTFSPTSVNLTTGSPSATFTYTPTSGAGNPHTISTTNGMGITETLTNPAGLSYLITGIVGPGVLSLTGVSSDVIGLTAGASAGGTPPYSNQLQVSVSGGAFANIGSPQSGLNWTISGLLGNTLYAFQNVVTDAASLTATSNQVSATTDVDGSTNARTVIPSVGGGQTSVKIGGAFTKPESVTILYGTSPTLSGAATTAPVICDTSTGFQWLITLPGLTPNTKYYYTEQANGVNKVSSSFPSFTTFKNVGGQVTKIGFGSCMRGVNGTDSAWGALPAVTAVFMIGDETYPDEAESAALTTFGVETNDVNYNRQLLRISLNATSGANTAWGALRKTTPVFTMIDDHDTGTNNYSGGVGIYYANAIQAWKELSGATNPAPMTAGQLYYKVDFVDFAVYVLDQRTYRSLATLADNNPKKIWGDTQMAALKADMLANNATYKFKIIANTTPWDGYANTQGDSFGGDSDTFQLPTGTNGYRFDRDLFLDWVTANAITGVCEITGDQHWGAAYKFTYNTRAYYGFQSTPINHTTLAPPATPVPDFTNGPIYFTYQNSNAGLLTIDTSTPGSESITFQLYSTTTSLGSGFTKTITKAAMDAGLSSGGGGGGGMDFDQHLVLPSEFDTVLTLFNGILCNEDAIVYIKDALGADSSITLKAGFAQPVVGTMIKSQGLSTGGGGINPNVKIWTLTTRA